MGATNKTPPSRWFFVLMMGKKERSILNSGKLGNLLKYI